MRRLFVITFFSALVLVACSVPSESDVSALAGPTGRITSVAPASGEADVAVDAHVRVTFNGEVRSDSPEDMLNLAEPDGTAVEGEVTLSEDGRAVTFVPAQFLSYGTEYSATVDASELSRGRGQPPRDFTHSWSFTTQPDPIVSVEVVSHQDGQQVFGPRTVVLSGTLSSGATITEVTVRHNGIELPPLLWDQTGFGVEVELRDNDDNRLEVVARNEAGKEGSASLGVSYPYFRLETGQSAKTYIGKYNHSWNYFMSGYGDNQFETPLFGNPVSDGGALYLPDMYNHRVLVFDPEPSSDGASATFAIGQDDFGTFPTPGNGANDLSRPGSVSIADGMLALADGGNSRVLIWNRVPVDNEVADVVVGQADFGHSTPACGRGRLDSPASVVMADGRLIVVDSGNNRVLVWNSIPSEHGVPADMVIGQRDFESCEENGGGGPGQATLRNPIDAWADGNRLIVADSGNNRVLSWHGFPSTDFASADVVVGQDRFDTGGAGAGEYRLNFPTYLASNGNQLFVADTYNNRMLVWDVIPESNGAPADYALGQGDLFCTIENSTSVDYGYCNYSYGEEVGKHMLYAPAGVHLDGGLLVIADGYNARYLIFESLPQGR
ncbi:MAG: Ig-like domain-containing protein [Trueperaceae bacterium]